jgi:WhiB family redox-sensing transcriptional regulator
MVEQTHGWIDGAACRDSDVEFFPESYDDGSLAVRRARALCGQCPVRRDCLEDALLVGERAHYDGKLTVARPGDHGIWGGTTPKERRFVRNYSVELAVELLDQVLYRKATEGAWRVLKKAAWVPLTS